MLQIGARVLHAGCPFWDDMLKGHQTGVPAGIVPMRVGGEACDGSGKPRPLLVGQKCGSDQSVDCSHVFREGEIVLLVPIK